MGKPEKIKEDIPDTAMCLYLQASYHDEDDHMVN